MVQKQTEQYSSMKVCGKQSFYPEDVGDKIIRNVGWLSAEYKAFYPRRHKSSPHLRIFDTTKLINLYLFCT
jgi:hypothetical protein